MQMVFRFYLCRILFIPNRMRNTRIASHSSSYNLQVCLQVLHKTSSFRLAHNNLAQLICSLWWAAWLLKLVPNHYQYRQIVPYVPILSVLSALNKNIFPHPFFWMFCFLNACLGSLEELGILMTDSWQSIAILAYERTTCVFFQVTPVGPWNTLFEKSHEHALQRQKVNSMVDRPILRRAAQLAQHLAPSSPHLVKKSAKSRLQMQRPSLSLLRIRLCTSEPPSVSPPWFFFLREALLLPAKIGYFCGEEMVVISRLP